MCQSIALAQTWGSTKRKRKPKKEAWNELLCWYKVVVWAAFYFNCIVVLKSDHVLNYYCDSIIVFIALPKYLRPPSNYLCVINIALQVRPASWAGRQAAKMLKMMRRSKMMTNSLRTRLAHPTWRQGNWPKVVSNKYQSDHQGIDPREIPFIHFPSQVLPVQVEVPNGKKRGGKTIVKKAPDLEEDALKKVEAFQT